MRVERDRNEFKVVLSPAELQLLRRALERASFIDTPASEQERILQFCSQALDALGDAEKSDRKVG